MVEPGFPGVAEAQCLSDTCGAVLPTLCLLGEAPLCAPAPVGEDGGVPGGQKGRGRLVGAHPVVPRYCHSTCQGGGRGVFCSTPFRDRDWSLSVSRGLERGVSVHLGLAGNFLRP